MIKDLGYSEFVLLLHNDDKAGFDYTVETYSSIADVIAEYDITTKDNKYWVVQLEIMCDNRSPEELCQFVYGHFPCIAMRQGGSTYILVPNKNEFKVMLNDIYTKEKRLYFLYDMLTIEERYDASCCTGVEIDPYSSNRLMHNVGGAIYSLIYGRECIYLFTSEPEISVMDETTGELKELDITDGLWAFKFHVAVLK